MNIVTLLLIGVIFSLSACRFHEDAGYSAKSVQSTRGTLDVGTSVNAYSVAVTPAEGISDTRILTPSRNGAIAAAVPIVIPMPVPNAISMRFNIRPMAGINLLPKAVGSIPGQDRTLSVEATGFQTNQTGSTVDVILYGLGDLVSPDSGIATQIALTFRTESDQQDVVLNLRTPPKPLKVTQQPVARSQQAIALGQNTLAQPLFRVVMANQSPDQYHAELQYVQRGKLLFTYLKTTNRQISNCAAETKQEAFNVQVSERFLLVPDNDHPKNYIRYLYEKKVPYSVVTIDPYSNVYFTLFAIVDAQHFDLSVGRKCRVGQVAQMNFACPCLQSHTVCSEWSIRQNGRFLLDRLLNHFIASAYAMPGGEPGPRCSQHETVCDQWGADSRTVQDSTEVIGTVLQLEAPLAASRAYYASVGGQFPYESAQFQTLPTFQAFGDGRSQAALVSEPTECLTPAPKELWISAENKK